MILVAIAAISLIFKPHILARLYIIGFLTQQLILNGCVMTAWENKVKVDAGFIPNKNEFIMEHTFSNPLIISLYKTLFMIIIIIQIHEIYRFFMNRKLNYKDLNGKF